MSLKSPKVQSAQSAKELGESLIPTARSVWTVTYETLSPLPDSLKVDGFSEEDLEKIFQLVNPISPKSNS